MAWTIEAKRLPIDFAGLGGGHLYIEIWNDSGDRYRQINGLATDPSTGSTVTVGDQNDLLKAYSNVQFAENESSILTVTETSTQSNHPHDGVVLFSGSESDVKLAYDYAKSAIEYINSQDYSYGLLTFNSNTVYSGIVTAMAQAIAIDSNAIDDAEDLGPFLAINFGVGTDIFQGNTWEVNVNDTSASGTGVVVYNTSSFKEGLIGTSGDDILHGLAGNDTIISGLGNNKVYGGADNDTIVIADGASGIYEGGSGDDTFIVEHSGQVDFTSSLTIKGGSGDNDKIILEHGDYIADNRDPKNVTISATDGSFRTTLNSIEEAHINVGRVLTNVNDDYELNVGPLFDYSFMTSAQGGLEVDIDIFTDASTNNGEVSYQRITDASIAVNGKAHAGTMFNDIISNANATQAQADLNGTSAGSYYGSNNGDVITIDGSGNTTSWMGGFSYILGAGDDTVTITNVSNGDFYFTYIGGDDVFNNIDGVSSIEVAGDIHIGDTSVSVTEVNGLTDTVVLTTPTGTLTLNDIGGEAFDIDFVSGGQYTFNTDGTYSQTGTTQSGYLLETSWGDDVVIDNDGIGRHYVSLDGSDSILAGAGYDTLNGGFGYDRLDGGAGDDTISSGGDDDVVLVGEGHDIVSTGTGSDLIVVKANALGSVSVTDFNTSSDKIDLSNVSNVSSFADLQIYSSGADTVFYVEDGNFNVTLENINSYFILDSHFNFSGGAYTFQLPLVPVTTVTGTAIGETLYTFDSFGAVIDGLGGDDVIDGYSGNDYLYGGAGGDTLTGDDGIDVLSGGAGLDGLYGGWGDDVYLFDMAVDTSMDFDYIYESEGIDVIKLEGNATTSSILLTSSFETLVITNSAAGNVWGGVTVEGQLAAPGTFEEDRIVEFIVVQDVVYDLQDVYNTGVWTPYVAGAGTGLNAEDDLITIDGGGIVTGNVLANNGNGVDYDADSLYLEVIPLSQSGAFGTFDIDVNGSFTITSPTNYIGNHSFSYTVKDSDGNEAQANVVLDFTVSNYAPVAGPMVSGYFVESGTNLSWTPTFTDADNDTLTYSMSLLDGSAVPYFSINSTTGEITGLADTTYGTYAVRITATDGIEEATHEMNLNVYLFTQGTTALDYLHGGEGIDVIWGDDGDDRLYGNEGNDELYGQAGNDRIYGHLGNDTIDGEDGWDLLYGLQGDDIIYGGIGNDVIRGDDDSALDTYIGAGNDELHGGDGGDSISGGAGNDELYGDAGNDYLYGSAGNDTAYGGDDNDRIYGEAGDDELHGDAGVDRLYGNEGSDLIFGGNDADYIYGQEDNDTMYGEDGNDIIYAHEGDDFLDGGTGDDQLFGLEGNDILYGGEGADRLIGDDDPATAGFVGAGNDILLGEGGNDVLGGGAGDDLIIGGTGVDALYGNAGADTFAYLLGDLDGSKDYIHDFSLAEGDTINIADVIDYSAANGDAIADFVTIFDGGTYVRVLADQDGTGTAHTALDVAQVQGNSGWDLNTLITNGTLIVE